MTTVPDSFDPYREWLDIPDGPRPPDHYTLLGLQPRESDPQAIAHAADIRMATLRRIRPGARLPDWGRLLDQLGAVKVCLLDPASKAAYDASLPTGTPSQPAPETTTSAPPDDQRCATDPPAEPQGQPSSFFADYGQMPSLDPSQQTPAATGYSEPAPGPSEPAPKQPFGVPTGPQPGAVDPASLDGMAPPGWLAAPSAPGVPSEPAAPANVQPQASAQAPAQQPAGTPIPVQGQSTPLRAIPIPATGHAAASAGTLTRQLSQSRLIIATLGVLVVVLLGALYHLMNREPEQVAVETPEQSQPDPEVPPAPPEVAQPPESPQPPDPAPENAADPDPTTPPSTPEEPEEPAEEPLPDPDLPLPETEPPAEPPPEPLDTKKQEAFGRAAARARAAMTDRDLAAMRENLQAVAANAQTPAERQRVARLELMADYLDEFWRGMRESVSKLDATQEIELQTTRIVVVESGPQELIVKAAGRLHRWAIEDIPTSVVMAIVRDCFPQGPAAKAIVGTFLAVDPKGDRAKARQMFEEAAQAGIDAKRLIPELDAPTQSDAGDPPQAAPPTDQTALQEAEQSLRQVFAKPLAEATSSAKKLELARELLARAAAANDDAATRFVMLREARDLAVASGDPALAGEAVDRMAHFFTVDALQMKTAAFEQVADTARGLSNQRNIATGALALFQQATEANRLDEAGRLAALALDAARKSRSLNLMKQAAAAGQQVEALRRQGEE